MTPARRTCAAIWPKAVPALTAEQRRIREDFMNHWLEVLPKRYRIIEVINHRFAIPKCAARNCRTLEIGAGLGAHIAYENLVDQDYTALELRPELAERIRKGYPSVRVLVGDVQERIESVNAAFDRVLAIHVLEHLPNL